MPRRCNRCGSGMNESTIKKRERNKAGERVTRNVGTEYKCPSCGHKINQ